MNILNIFKKKPSEPEAAKIETLLPEQHYVKISLEIEYLLGKQLYIYNTNYTIKTENEQLFNESKEKQVKILNAIIKDIHEKLDDKSSDYVCVGEAMLLKKSDFVNARIVYNYKKTNEHPRS
jgi:hypothetical protein